MAIVEVVAEEVKVGDTILFGGEYRQVIDVCDNDSLGGVWIYFRGYYDSFFAYGKVVKKTIS